MVGLSLLFPAPGLKSGAEPLWSFLHLLALASVIQDSSRARGSSAPCFAGLMVGCDVPILSDLVFDHASVIEAQPKCCTGNARCMDRKTKILIVSLRGCTREKVWKVWRKWNSDSPNCVVTITFGDQETMDFDRKAGFLDSKLLYGLVAATQFPSIE